MTTALGAVRLAERCQVVPERRGLVHGDGLHAFTRRFALRHDVVPRARIGALWWPLVIGKKKRIVTEGPRRRPKPERVSYPVAVLIRMFLIGAVAVIASIWALWRHYTIPLAPMVVPVPPAQSAGETEIEIETTPP